MFKRFWQSINKWADVLSMDDPRGDYMFRLEKGSSDPVTNNDGWAGGPCSSIAIVKVKAPETPVRQPTCKVI